MHLRRVMCLKDSTSAIPHQPLLPPLGVVSSTSDGIPCSIEKDTDKRVLIYVNRTQSGSHDVGSWGCEAGEEIGACGAILRGEA